MSVGIVLMGVGAGGRPALGSGKSMQVTGSTIVVVCTAFCFYRPEKPFSPLSLIGVLFLGGPGFVLLLTGTLARLYGRQPASPATASVKPLGL